MTPVWVNRAAKRAHRLSARLGSDGVGYGQTLRGLSSSGPEEAA